MEKRMPSHPISFGIVCGQRASYAELVNRIETVQATGWDTFDVVDHFYGLFDVMEPTHEAYTMLAALAPHSTTLRLGVMVCGNTYRNPAFLLKQANTVDEISGGRVTFGVGAGWARREHEAYGWELPPPKERVDMFAEALEIWGLLQTQERTTYLGKYYELIDAPFEPKSRQSPRLPVLIGGQGPRMLRLTAKHADNWNARGTPEEAGAANRRLDDACREVGRDPVAIVRSISPTAVFLESPGAFEHHFHAYRDQGFTDFRIPWPRNEAQKVVFDEVVVDLLPRLRSS
jgi:alkanesulfonate monooxygenase SsuD/methylene tetrahydromethanopterin reductase-like flavin-dependent oxidoreductase (luciferase family)